MNVADRLLAFVLISLLLVPFAACSRNWTSAGPDYPMGLQPPTPTGRPVRVVRSGSPRPEQPSQRAETPRPPEIVSQHTEPSSGVIAADAELPLQQPGTPQFTLASFNPISPLLQATGPPRPATGPLLQTTYQPSDNSPLQPLPPISCEQDCGLGLCGSGGFRSQAMSNVGLFCRDVVSDHRNYYSWNTMRDFFVGIALAAPLANTSLDDNFQDWYQADVRSVDTDRFASFWETLGEGEIFIPAFVCLGLACVPFDDLPILGPAGEFGGRVTRGYLVGGPPMLLMQWVLGAGRPDEWSTGSQWRPFHDTNAVSGHAFMGAVPLITAARMVENPWLRGTLYGLSTFTAWSRVNDDRHYLSQACLGWWMGYLACRAVDDTESRNPNYTLMPIATPEMSGVAMLLRR